MRPSWAVQAQTSIRVFPQRKAASGVRRADGASIQRRRGAEDLPSNRVGNVRSRGLKTNALHAVPFQKEAPPMRDEAPSRKVSRVRYASEDTTAGRPQG
jgi:hypothetical protein